MEILWVMPLLFLSVCTYMWRKRLQSNKAVEFDVFGFVDDSHDALSEFGYNFCSGEWFLPITIFSHLLNC